MRLLPGVDPAGIQPELLLALQIAEPIWRRFGAEELWVTSIRDGQHKTGSFHYVGKAVDLRVKNLPLGTWESVRAALQAAVGPQYDVLLEDSPPHIHIEHDPLKLNHA